MRRRWSPRDPAAQERLIREWHRRRAEYAAIDRWTLGLLVAVMLAAMVAACLLG